MVKSYVSVIIPTYNRAELVKKAIFSVLNQNYKELEIILVDDASTDETEEVIKELQTIYGTDKIIYIKNETNQGAAQARNIGIAQAKYEYIAFLDSDDVWHETKLERQVKVLNESSEKVGLVYCEYLYHQIDGTCGICPDKEIPVALKQGDMFLSLLILPMIGTPSMMVKKSCLHKVGGFDPSFPCLEDYELSLRIAKDYEIAFIPEVLFEAYARNESVTNNVKGTFEAKIAIIRKYYVELKENELFDMVVEALLEKADILGMKHDVKAYLDSQLIEFET